MTKEDKDKMSIDFIFEHLSRLLICVAVMTGGGVMIKFNQLITTSYPKAIIVSVIIVMLIGLTLTVYIVCDVWLKIGEIFQSKIKGLIYGGLYVFLALSMVMALFLSTINA